MKLEYVEFSGYKSFPGDDAGSLQHFDLAPLTLIFGKNNSGKSAVARLPRLLLGGLACADDCILPLEVHGLAYGGRFLDLIHGGDFFGRPSFKLRASHEDEILEVAVTLFSPGAIEKDALPRVWSYEMTSPEAERRAATTKPEGWPGFAGLLPAGKRWDSWRAAASNLLEQVVHLGPMRAPIQPAYAAERPTPLGMDGAEAPQWLQAESEFADAVEEWFAEHMDGWRLQVSRSNETFDLRIQRSAKLSTNLARAGEGMKQVLPVVVHQLWRQQGSHEPFLDIVEQPELHLHDAAQAPLADLFIDTALKGEGQVIVESHSEPLLLRVQRRVAEGKISPDRIAIYFVDVDEKGSQLRRVGLNADGEVEWWPPGVFEEDFQEVAAISRAQRRRAGSTSR